MLICLFVHRFINTLHFQAFVSNYLQMNYLTCFELVIKKTLFAIIHLSSGQSSHSSRPWTSIEPLCVCGLYNFAANKANLQEIHGKLQTGFYTYIIGTKNAKSKSLTCLTFT
jgi:hypothetical protein